MAPGQDFARYLKWGLATAVGGAALVITLIATIDPYRLFGVVDVAGFNHTKPQPDQYREQIKIAQARSMRANTLFFGNSRVENGLNPDNRQLRARGLSAYNLGLSGTRLSVAQRAFDGVRGGARPVMAVVGVEFQDFLIDPAHPPARSAKAPTGNLQWRMETMFSMTSALDAIKTLRIQHDAEAETMSPRGLNPLLDYRRYAREEGYYAIFQQRAEENAKALARRPHGLLVAGTDSSEEFAQLHQMLAALAADGAEIHLVIYPYHAQLLAMFEQAGLWPAFEQWKALVLREADAVKRERPGARITLWDFSGFWPVQCERIPAKGDTRSATRWYWEAGHFKTSLGDLILDRVLGGAGPIGQVLTADNLEQNRQRIGAERARCAADYPELFTKAAAMIEAARPAHAGP